MSKSWKTIESTQRKQKVTEWLYFKTVHWQTLYRAQNKPEVFIKVKPEPNCKSPTPFAALMGLDF